MALAAAAVSGTLALGFLGWRLWPAGEPSVIKETVIASRAVEAIDVAKTVDTITTPVTTPTDKTETASIQEPTLPEPTGPRPITNPTLRRVHTIHPLHGRLMTELTNHIRMRNAVLKRREERRIEYQARLHHDEVCKAVKQVREALLVERGYYEHKQHLVGVLVEYLAHPLTYRSVPPPPPPPPPMTVSSAPISKIPTREIPLPAKFFDELRQPHQLKPAINRQLKPKIPSLGDVHKAELFRAIQHRGQVFPSE